MEMADTPTAIRVMDANTSLADTMVGASIALGIRRLPRIIMKRRSRKMSKKGKAKPSALKCPECGSENVAVLCFEGEPTTFACDECDHEWREADRDG